MAAQNVEQLVKDFARGIELADARRPTAVNQRSKVPFQPGIGPHSEAATVELVMSDLAVGQPDRYAAHRAGVPYPSAPRQRCDLCLGVGPQWTWAIEVKLLRFMGDNGQPNDNMLMHILSPYPAHRSALTDCTKLIGSGLAGRKAIVIYGFESAEWPLGIAVDAFELLARARVRLSARSSSSFSGLVHPVHTAGGVFGWEIEGGIEG